MAQTNTLYVLLHGSICLVDKGTNASESQAFAAYLLDQGDAHTYMCGPFLAEQELKPNGQSPMNLHFTDEITGGSGKLDASTNPVAQLTAVPSATSGVRAVLTLPQPQKISYYLRGDIASSTLTAPEGAFQQPPSTLSAVKILEYAFGDFTKVKLMDDSGNVLWSCPKPAQVAADKMAVAIHIYDEPPVTMPKPDADAHNVKEFNDCMAFLKVPDIKISVPATVNLQPLLKPVGILGWEVAALDFRNSVGTINHIDSLRVDGAAGDPLGGGGGTQVCGVPDGAVVP